MVSYKKRYRLSLFLLILVAVVQNVVSFPNSNVIKTLPPPCLSPSSLLQSTNLDSDADDDDNEVQIKINEIMEKTDRSVTILSRGTNHIVAMKPPSVVCHHSSWAGSRKRRLKVGEEPEIPMLQRVRDAIDCIDNAGKISDDDANANTNTNANVTVNPQDGNERSARKINLVHRLDRGASGALLFAFADDDTDDNTMEEIEEGNVQEVIEESEEVAANDDSHDSHDQHQKKERKKGATAILQAEMAKSTTTKTYVALVRGEGILRGEDLKQKGWFEINRPIKDEKGRLNDATTLIRFVAGQAEPQDDDSEDQRLAQPRMSLVLARPQDGRWHQIRRHLNGLSHPILGDTSHGSSKTNREWKEKRNLPGERICLHMARLQMNPTEFTPNGIDCSSPLPQDMLDMLQVYAPDLLKEALPVLEEEGILLKPDKKYQVGSYTIPVALLKQMMGIDEETNKKPKKIDVKILYKSDNFVVAAKPPGVVVHNSSWNKRRNEPMPMVQRVRDLTGRKVNPIHRLDRSASGCLIFSFAENKNKGIEFDSREVTKILIDSLQSEDATKTYLALCDGDGTWNGINYMEKGWFTMNKSVKDEWDKPIEAETDICFIAGMTLPSSEGDEDVREGRKVSLVLARPKTGKFHQIRQHLASGTIGHAILGDSSHGRSRTNRIWKKKRHLIKERTCLHLLQVKLPPTKFSPDGIECSSPLPQDMLNMLSAMPELLDKARPLLLNEGIDL